MTFKLHSTLMTGAVLASALLAGCGSSDGDGGQVGSGPGTGPGTPGTPPPVQQTITAVADYVRNLIAGSTADNTQPLDINGLTLAADDQAQPAPVN